MKNKTSSSAPSKSQRPMPAGPARFARKNQAMLDRSASLGDSGPKTARFAPSKSPRPMPAGPAREVRAGQGMFDRISRLGDSGPKGMKKGYMSGGVVKVKGYMSGGVVKVKGGSGCKTY